MPIRVQKTENRVQKTEDRGQIGLRRFAPGRGRKTRRPVFRLSGAKRRKPICLLSSLSSVF
ncbi:MAG: hypothetical protein LBD06_00595, partial [Candidatus Accumulibacter sp.]|nr:hypothetical protein [Accumulibacter sp.]